MCFKSGSRFQGKRRQDSACAGCPRGRAPREPHGAGHVPAPSLRAVTPHVPQPCGCCGRWRGQRGYGTPHQPRRVPEASRSWWPDGGGQEEMVGRDVPTPAAVPLPAALRCPHQLRPDELRNAGNGAGNGLGLLVQGGRRGGCRSQPGAPDLAPAAASVPGQDPAPGLGRRAQTSMSFAHPLARQHVR